MAFGTSVRTALRTVIENFGNDSSLYSYSGATKSTDTEGKTTVSDWKTATSVKLIPEDHTEIRNLKLPQGEETTGEGVFWIKDNVTIGKRDKITYNSINYQVDEINPTIINSTKVAVRIVISRM